MTSPRRHTDLSWQYAIGEYVVRDHSIPESWIKDHFPYSHNRLPLLPLTTTIMQTKIERDGILYLRFAEIPQFLFPAELFIPANKQRLRESQEAVQSIPDNQMIDAFANIITNLPKKGKEE